MKIYSWNVNGLRAVHKKGALDGLLKKQKPDILLLQEIKGHEDKFPDEIKNNKNYNVYFNPAQKAGYAGTAIYINKKYKETKVKKGFPRYKDIDGRVFSIWVGDIVCFSIYVQNGGKSEEAYQEKLKFYEAFSKYLKKLVKDGYKIIVGGDFNVAFSELDLAEPEKHLDHTHFCPKVRHAAESFIRNGFIDTYRTRNPKKEGSYTYWDNFDFSLKGVKPREINRGWRLDYFFVDEKTNKNSIKKVFIHDDILGSDHCPISITIG